MQTMGRESTDAPLQANARMENPPFLHIHVVVEMRNYHLYSFVMLCSLKGNWGKNDNRGATILFSPG